VTGRTLPFAGERRPDPHEAVYFLLLAALAPIPFKRGNSALRNWLGLESSGRKRSHEMQGGSNVQVPQASLPKLVEDDKAAAARHRDNLPEALIPHPGWGDANPLRAAIAGPHGRIVAMLCRQGTLVRNSVS